MFMASDKSKRFVFGLFAILMTLATVIATAPASAQTPPASNVVSKVPIAIDVITSSSLCGNTMTNPSERVCIGNNTNEVAVNDTVGKIKTFILGSGQFCGIDERGVRCWGTANRYEMPIQKILSSGDATRARLNIDKICIPKKDQKIYCYSPEQGVWVESVPGSGDPNRYTRHIPPVEIYGPFADLRDFQITTNEICILDGERVTCQKFKSHANTGNSQMAKMGRAFPGARALSMTSEAYCVLHDEGVDCLRATGFEDVLEFQLRGPWKGARQLFNMGYESVCALDAGGAPVCAQLGQKSGEMSDGMPIEFQKPEIKITNFKANGDSRCAVLENSKDGSRDLYCGSYQSHDRVGPADQFADFAVAPEAVCTVDKKSIVTCFYRNSNLDSPLPEDGSPVHSAGKCRWNDSRFHCSATEMKMDFGDIKTVLNTTKNSEELPFPCVIYESRSGLRSVKCINGSSQNAEEVPSLDPSNDKIEATYNYTCVYGSAEPNCWGQPLGGVRPPNLSNVKKMVFSRDFGCANDQFGFLCWGERLEERGLVIPTGLSDLDAVTDFALGSNHICAISRDHTVLCWGSNQSGQTDVPRLMNPVSIAAAGNTTCATADEGVVCWGQREDSLLSPARSSAALLNSPVSGNRRN